MSDKTIESIICDECSKELIQDTQYHAMYSLQLKAINTNRPTSRMLYSIMVYPPIKETLHFCGLKCLRSWTKDES